MASSWIWDNSRRDHYMWNESERRYVYASEMTRSRDGYETAPRPNTPDSNRPRRQSTSEQSQASPSVGSATTGSNYSYRTDYSYRSDLSEQFSNLSLAGRSTGQLSSSAPAAYYHNSTPSFPYPSSYAQPSYDSGQTAGQYYAQSSNQNSTQNSTQNSNQNNPQNGTENSTQSSITRSHLHRYDQRRTNTYAYGYISGTAGETERLDPRFRIRRPGYRFFTIGKVFRMVWTEPAGKPNSSVSEILCPTPFGTEKLIAKIRWFVVVLPGQDNQCQCLPINTYQNQGVAKRGVIKAHHAIIHDDDKRPFMSRNEEPASGEDGMLSPIRVKGHNEYDRLHNMARINFSRTYTIEHNVKVYDFGDVVRADIPVLRSQWQTVRDAETRRAYRNQMTAVPEEQGEEGSWEEQEEEEEYEDEQ